MYHWACRWLANCARNYWWGANCHGYVENICLGKNNRPCDIQAYAEVGLRDGFIFGKITTPKKREQHWSTVRTCPRMVNPWLYFFLKKNISWMIITGMMIWAVLEGSIFDAIGVGAGYFYEKKSQPLEKVNSAIPRVSYVFIRLHNLILPIICSVITRQSKIRQYRGNPWPRKSLLFQFKK